MSRASSTRVIGVTLLAFTAAVFGWALFGEFVYDDRRLIVDNDLLCRYAAGAPTRDGAQPLYRMLGADFAKTAVARDGQTHRIAIDYFRPMIVWSYALDATFWGEATFERGEARWQRLNPVGFHLTNLLFHLLNVALVFRVLRGLRLGTGVATATAALFALHPIHVENVAWIAGRTDVLGTTGFLAALWCYVRGRRRQRTGWLVAGFGFGLAAIFAKEMTAVLAPIVLLVEAWAGGRAWPASGRRRYLVAALYALPVPIYFAVKATVGAGGGDAAVLWAGISLPTIAASFARAIGWYSGKLVWPWPPDIDPILPFAAIATGAAYAAGAVALLVIAYRWRKTPAALGVFGFFVCLAPLSCLVPGARLLRVSPETQFPVAERFLYLPSVFALLAIAASIGGSRPGLRLGAVFLLANLAALGTFLRIPDWRSDLALFKRAVATDPDNARMRMNLGLTLLQDWRASRARSYLQDSIRVSDRKGIPRPALVFRGLAGCYDLEGAHERALAMLAEAVRLEPSAASEADYALSLAVKAGMQNDVGALRESLQRFRRAFERDPGFVAAREHHAALGRVLAAWVAPPSERAMAKRLTTFPFLAKLCETATPPRWLEAITILDTARRLVPEVGDTLAGPNVDNARTVLDQAMSRMIIAARRSVREKLRADPDHATAHFLLGEITRRVAAATDDTRALVEAETSLRDALTRDPGHTRAALSLAAILIERGREREAIQILDEAARKRYGNHDLDAHEILLDTLEVAWVRSSKNAAWRVMIERIARDIEDSIPPGPRERFTRSVQSLVANEAQPGR